MAQTGCGIYIAMSLQLLLSAEWESERVKSFNIIVDKAYASLCGLSINHIAPLRENGKADGAAEFRIIPANGVEQ